MQQTKCTKTKNGERTTSKRILHRPTHLSPLRGLQGIPLIGKVIASFQAIERIAAPFEFIGERCAGVLTELFIVRIAVVRGPELFLQRSFTLFTFTLARRRRGAVKARRRYGLKRWGR